MDRNRVLRLFAGMAELEMEKAVEKLPLIDYCIRQLNAKRRPGVTADQDAMEYACAAVAAYRYCLTGSGEPAVKAGEVTVTPKSAQEKLMAAKAARDEYLLACAPYLQDTDFVFCQAVAG